MPEKKKIITVLHDSAEPVVWAVWLPDANIETLTACSTKTREPIKTKFGMSDYVMEDNKSRKKVWESVEQWRPHAGAVCQSFVTFFPPFFFLPDAPRSDAA